MPDLPNPLSAAAAVPFGLGAAVRGKKVFHPDGVVRAGRWRVTTGTTLVHGVPALRRGFEHDALVRLSRGAGLPGSLPDILGIAVRLPDVGGAGAHQDVLVNTSIDAPLLHHLLLPARGWFSMPYTTSLPYGHGDARFLLGLLPPSEDRVGPTLEALTDRLARGPVTFRLAVSTLEGRFRPVGELEVGAPAPTPDVAFNPWNTACGLRPAGAINRVRRDAYRLSQRAWRARRGTPSAVAPRRA